MNKNAIRYINSKLNRFISAMDLVGVTPSEDEIDAFLTATQKVYREVFIKFCFHYWERRHEKYIVNKAIAELQLNNAL